MLSALAAGCGGVEEIEGDDTGDFPDPTVGAPPVSTTRPPVTATDQPPDTIPDDDAAAGAAEVVEGQITHDVPAEMVEGETYAVVVRVGAQGSEEEFLEAVGAAGVELGEEEVENIESLPRVTPEMKVILAAPPSFRVRQENSAKQELGQDGVGRWGYQIEPTQPGEHEIRITAEIIVGESVESLEPVYDGTISVAVADKPLLEDLSSRINPLVGFLVVIAAIASGLGGVIAVRDHLERSRAEQGAGAASEAGDGDTSPPASELPPPPSSPPTGPPDRPGPEPPG